MRSICILLLLASCSKPPAPAVSVYAASSLRELMEDVAAEWRKRGGGAADFQFEATSTLARQISEGAKADVFLVAAPEWLDKVKTTARRDWLSNRLVLVVPKDAKDPDPKALASLALAGEQVPVGKYARAAMKQQGFPIPERAIMGANVRDVLSKVSEGGAQAGVVYATDVAIDPGVRVALTFPAESHPKIVYAAGLLTPAGRAFYDVLKEPWVMELARRRGFGD